ncbi:MAG: hypothetical protein O7H39_01970 [Gammaproteobacteria bacterium]|nr:hypothetical protein [Gammaproteobacteria bacterium]
MDEVLDALSGALSLMAVRVEDAALRAARVSAIHYSKNMAFTDYTTCSMVMRELDLIDLHRRLDLSRTDYRNEGHAIRYHANSFEVTFYDKLKDMQQARISEKRSIERDYGPQLDLFNDRDAFPKQLQVLRMEVRLRNRTKIRSVMKQIGAELEPTFAALFDASIAKDVLLHFWGNVRKQLPRIGQARTQRPEDLLASLAVAANGTARPGALLQQLGCLMLIGSVGMRGAGAIMSRHCSARSWQRYKRQLKDLALADANGFSALKQVDEALERFQPLRMSCFHESSTAGSMTGISR